MSILKNATTGKQPKPRRILVYGGHGEGKSTWAAKFPNAIFLATEDGTNDIDCTRVSLTNVNDFVEAVKECIDSEYDTIVVDSLDWLQKIFEKHMEETGVQTDYGKGALYLEAKFSAILRGLDKAVEKGKTIVLIAHSEIHRGENETRDGLIFDADFLLVDNEDICRAPAGALQISVASTSGRRILCTESHPSYIAKSRVKLPATIDLNDSIEQFLV